jgi:two-component system, NarL family, sensor kinase
MDSRTHPASHYPDHRAWAEMLAGFAEKNARLSDIVAKRCPVRSGFALLTELERERSRIARELHAGAGQPLAGIKLHLEILNECTSGLPDSAWGDPARGESAKVAIGRLQILAEQALGQVRALSHWLHPPDWQEMTIEQAMESLVESSGLSGKLLLKCDFRPLQEEPSHAVKVQLYRCAQECISNIIRHSRATEATVALAAEDGRLLLTVTDNGHGFDTAERNSGIGLRAIGENAASLGGTASISSGPDGTKIRVSLPSSAD